jgi:DNA adenine methylase
MIFRYPGSKQKLLPIILPAIEQKLLAADNNTFHDVFVGGGSVSIALAKKYPNLKIQMNDVNENVYSFWKLISEGDAVKISELKKLIQIEPTVENFSAMRANSPKEDFEKAYYAIFFNRCTFSGIEMAGPIGGMEQKSKWKIDCRYNSKKLIKQIDELILLFKGRLEVFNADVWIYIFWNKSGVYYLDPPYYKQGKSLYRHYMCDDEHAELRYRLNNRNDWVLSYDNCDFIKDLYKDRNISYIDARYCINGKKEDWNACKELLII